MKEKTGQIEGSCWYWSSDGQRFAAFADTAPQDETAFWEGMEGSFEGDRIGLLLDLDQGSITVYKDDVKMGVLVAAGVTGPLCWASILYRAEECPAVRVRIENRAAPASPTEEELAAAIAWAPADDAPEHYM